MIGVVGASFTDLVAYTPRLPGPGETIKGSKFCTGFGGKAANQAVQAALLGGRVALVSKVGNDSFGDNMLANLKARGVDTAHVSIAEGVSSGVAPIAVDDKGENSIVIVPGACDQLTPADVHAARDMIRGCKVLLCQLEIPLEVTQAALDVAREAGVFTVLNTAPALPALPDALLAACDLVCPNQSELTILTGLPTKTIEEAREAAMKVLQRGCKMVLVTMGAQGAMLVSPDGKYAHVATTKVTPRDTTGAGDSFLGALACYLASGQSLETAMAGACKVASVSVTREGTQSSYPNAEEMEGGERPTKRPRLDSNKGFDIEDPNTGQVSGRFEFQAWEGVSRCVDGAHAAFQSWRRLPFADRAVHVKNIAAALRKQAPALAEVMAREMGKPVKQGAAEVEKCAQVCEFFADNAHSLLEREEVHGTPYAQSFLVYRPLGVLYGVMPWNYPCYQIIRFAAAAWMAGNTVLLSHAPICTKTALALEALVADAGAPKGLLSALVIDHATAKRVIEHPHVRAVTLTGSCRAGRAVGASAGAALKPVVLELGGSDPYLVLEDADIAHAAKTCVDARMKNSGQVCISAKRLIVVSAVYDEFKAKVLSLVEAHARGMGSALDANTTFGPLARRDIRDGVHAQVLRSVERGAKLLCGGVVPDRPGFFYPPTVLDHVAPGMPAFDEEVFGPVVALVRADDEAHAVALANQTPFGLGAAVFTQNIARGQRICEEELEAGTANVNTAVSSDPRLPFGGSKDSGFGRELGAHGIRQFTVLKTVCVKVVGSS